jgi:hypothetical protein
LEVEAQGPREKVRGALEGISGVRRVSNGESEGEYLVEADRDMREEIARALAAAGLALRGLQRRGRTLEEVFVTAISTEKGHAT